MLLIANDRSFALCRLLLSEYLAEPRVETFRRALNVLPMFGTVENMLAFAEALEKKRCQERMA
jgi:hypothetical protein